MRNETIHITRTQIAQAAGLLGGAALLIGFLGWLYTSSLSDYVAVLLGVGAAGVVLWALLNPREFINLLTGRQARYGTLAVFSTLLLIGIVALTYNLVQRATITVDMTEGQRFSLTPTSLQLIQRIDRPIQITGFYSPRALQLREVDDQFFRLYETASNGLIRRVYYDPDRDPAIAQNFGVNQDGMVFVSYLSADGSVDFNSLARVPRGSRQERDLSSAIARLLISGTITVYFEVGHGERNPLDDSAEGISGVHNGVQENGLITQPINLVELERQGGSIPADAAALIMARPTVDISDRAIDILDDYLKRGGRLFIMADPLFSENAFLRQDSNFNSFLWNFYGIRALDMVVVDPVASAQTALDIIGAQVFTGGNVGIGERLDPAQYPLLFRLARALEVNFESGPTGVSTGQIVTSSEGSYGETNLQAIAETNTYQFDEGVDAVGPLTTVAWARDEKTDARILLVGDSDFITNGQVLTGGNGILFTDGLSWLTDYNERLQLDFPIRAFETNLPLIVIDNQTINAIRFVTLILIPGGFLVIGLIVWLRRATR